jgi:hypothetical protein
MADSETDPTKGLALKDSSPQYPNVNYASAYPMSYPSRSESFYTQTSTALEMPLASMQRETQRMEMMPQQMPFGMMMNPHMAMSMPMSMPMLQNGQFAQNGPMMNGQFAQNGPMMNGQFAPNGPMPNGQFPDGQFRNGMMLNQNAQIMQMNGQLLQANQNGMQQMVLIPASMLQGNFPMVGLPQSMTHMVADVNVEQAEPEPEVEKLRPRKRAPPIREDASPTINPVKRSGKSNDKKKHVVRINIPSNKVIVCDMWEIVCFSWSSNTSRENSYECEEIQLSD